MEQHHAGFQQLALPTRHDTARLRALERLGRTPRDFLLDNMLFWARRAAYFDREAARAWEEAEIFSEDDVEHLDEAAQKNYRRRWAEANAKRDAALNSLIQARDKLQSCAVKAAPYCHPRMLAIAMRNMNDDPFLSGNTPEGDAARTSNVLQLPANTPEELTKHYLKLVAGR